MSGSRLSFRGLRALSPVACALLLVVLCGSARAAPIFDSYSFSGAAITLDFASALSDGAGFSVGDPLGPSTAQPLADVVFSGMVEEPFFGSPPFPGRHVAAESGTSPHVVRIQFTTPVLAFAADVMAGNALDAGSNPLHVTFVATFEDASTQAFQFPLEPGEFPSFPSGTSLSNPPFPSPRFLGFAADSALNGITMIEIFHSTPGAPLTVYGGTGSSSLPTFPRVGGVAKIEPVPEPATALLVALALTGLTFAERSFPRRER